MKTPAQILDACDLERLLGPPGETRSDDGRKVVCRTCADQAIAAAALDREIMERKIRHGLQRIAKLERQCRAAHLELAGMPKRIKKNERSVAAAVLAEREACAEVADEVGCANGSRWNHDGGCCESHKAAAAAIRGRST